MRPGWYFLVWQEDSKPEWRFKVFLTASKDKVLASEGIAPILFISWSLHIGARSSVRDTCALAIVIRFGSR
jgi:hypothetical protein